MSTICDATITSGRAPIARNVPPLGIVTVVPVSTQVSTPPIVMMCEQFAATFVSNEVVLESWRGDAGAVGRHVMPNPAPKQRRASTGIEVSGRASIDESPGGMSSPADGFTLVEKLQPATNAINSDDRTRPYYRDRDALA
ncbi:MAG: hypothetical protein M4D80_01720 [Myxococcota bacterium]|nr:hypothetical protein [Myxococcota bacterium]